MKQKIFVFFCFFISNLCSTPNLQTSNLTGIYVRCAKKNLSYARAIQLLQDGTIKKIRTEPPFVRNYTYNTVIPTSVMPPAAIESASTASATEEQKLGTIESIGSLDSIKSFFPTFFYKNLKSHARYISNVLVPEKKIAKLIFFLFPSHNGEFKVNNLSSCFLGTSFGAAIIKHILNTLISETPGEATDAQIILESLEIAKAFEPSMTPKRRRSIQAELGEFLQTLREAIDESRSLDIQNRNLPINILMSYLWEKSRTYEEAIRGLTIYPETEAVAYTQADVIREAEIITHLKESDPSKIFPPILDKVVLKFGEAQHADCAEVTVRNFLNLILLNSNGSVKDEFVYLVSNSSFLSGLYSLTNFSSNLLNDEEKARQWHEALMSISVICTPENPETEMETGFDNFISTLNKILKITTIADTAEDQLNTICRTLSDENTIIDWYKDSGAKGTIYYSDRVIISMRTSRKTKRFSINQSVGHAYIAF
ncbi:MAG: hypothetical protein KBD04_02590 [Proteobacteria bacterium]|nr:hypothetical protein [Pseudomonadota bacterium]